MITLDGDALLQRWIEAVGEGGERVRLLAQNMSVGFTPAPSGLGVTVPWVPGCTARDLVGHLGTVHRWATAIDGLDELLTVVIPRWAHSEPPITAHATCAVTATDTGRRWRVRVDSDAVTVEPDSRGMDDATLEGSADELLLRLWGRPARVTVAGNPAAEAIRRGR